ncbi:MAG: hypothetical protein RMN25_03530 [Anaerolineae bacterium]|nr:DUF1641 domain-containing protein [Thermoflexales bacterium]MDW8406831.1 hypothetical protein [Anaerolineae bacterium]
MDAAIAELNQKIDALTAQVQYLTEQAQVAERARRQREELMHDLMPVAHSAMRLATEQLQEIEAYVQPEDLIRLLKKLARAAPMLEQLLDQLQGLKDLLDVVTPMTRDMFHKAEQALDTLDRKGYFTFAQGGMHIVDNIVTSFTEEDVRQLGDNIVLILRTVKEMTQPEVMNFLRNTVTLTEQELEAPVDISYRALISQMRDPNVRRGLALTMRMLSSIGAQAGG